MFNIIHLMGDGISKEISFQATKLLKTISNKTKYRFNINNCHIGYSSYLKYKTPLTDDTINKCINSDGILLGAIGDPRGDSLPVEQRPERGLLRLRKELDLFCNIRPIKNNININNPIFNKDYMKDIDISIFRELSHGIYDSTGLITEHEASDLMQYNRFTIERILNEAFQLAELQNKSVTIIDKANVLRCSRLWRSIGKEFEEKFSNVKVNYQYVDSAAFDLIKNPNKYEIIATSNLFGDILSDESAILVSSLGLLPSASLSGKYNTGLYEPVHGSAPDIAGMNKANPIGMILSTSMMFKYSLNLPEISIAIDNAVNKTIDSGYRTVDIYNLNSDILLNTDEMGDMICNNLEL